MGAIARSEWHPQIALKLPTVRPKKTWKSSKALAGHGQKGRPILLQRPQPLPQLQQSSNQVQHLHGALLRTTLMRRQAAHQSPLLGCGPPLNRGGRLPVLRARPAALLRRGCPLRVLRALPAALLRCLLQVRRPWPAARLQVLRARQGALLRPAARQLQRRAAELRRLLHPVQQAKRASVLLQQQGLHQ